MRKRNRPTVRKQIPVNLRRREGAHRDRTKYNREIDKRDNLDAFLDFDSRDFLNSNTNGENE